MNKCYLGLDIGSITTKGVIIDGNKQIIAKDYLYIEGNPILAVKTILERLLTQLNKEKYKVVSIGTTGVYRKLIGTMLGANVIKNEITSHTIGTTSIYSDVNTIFDLGGKDLKVIILNKGIVIDYIITNNFIALIKPDISNKNKHNKENIYKIVSSYLNNIIKSSNIKTPIVFQGGVSKNTDIIRILKKLIGKNIIVDENSHLMGALGAAVLALNSSVEKEFNFNLKSVKFETKEIECKKCNNKCEIICICKDDKIIDFWGNRCDKASIETINV